MNSLRSDDEKLGEASSVLDSSALLACALGETGADDVLSALAAGAAISAVNLAETYTKLNDLGGSVEESRQLIMALSPVVVQFNEQDAEVAASLREATRSRGLSLGDRSCLALGLTMGLPVLTADHGWEGLDLKVPINLIR